MFNLLAKTQNDFITTVFPILRYILFFVIVASAITMIVVIMMQKESAGGTDVITGKQESYYSQNKGSTREGRLKKITTIMAIVIAVATILYFVTEIINKSV
jgi:preprotein translocase subunit SecG